MLSRAATKTALAMALAALCACPLEAAPGPVQQDTARKSALAGILVVEGDSDCAPYVFSGPKGEATGYEVEMLKAIAAKRGVEIEFRLKPWNMALRDLCLKKADILL